MNDLDKQLAELALINKSELPPNPGGTLGKKVGPAVPPKPKKTQPQVGPQITFRTSMPNEAWFSDTTIISAQTNRRTLLLISSTIHPILLQFASNKFIFEHFIDVKRLQLC